LTNEAFLEASSNNIQKWEKPHSAPESPSYPAKPYEPFYREALTSKQHLASKLLNLSVVQRRAFVAHNFPSTLCMSALCKSAVQLAQHFNNRLTITPAIQISLFDETACTNNGDDGPTCRLNSRIENARV